MKTANFRISCNDAFTELHKKLSKHLVFTKRFLPSPFPNSTLVSAGEYAFEDEILWFLIAHDVRNNCVRLCFMTMFRQRLICGSHVKAFSGLHLIFSGLDFRCDIIEKAGYITSLAFRSLIIFMRLVLCRTNCAKNFVARNISLSFFSMTCDEFKLSGNLFTTRNARKI